MTIQSVYLKYISATGQKFLNEAGEKASAARIRFEQLCKDAQEMAKRPAEEEVIL